MRDQIFRQLGLTLFVVIASTVAAFAPHYRKPTGLLRDLLRCLKQRTLSQRVRGRLPATNWLRRMTMAHPAIPELDFPSAPS
jgi:hypothetical protein